MIKLTSLLKEDYGGDTYNIGMKQYTTSKPKLSQNETEKIKGADGRGCWDGYRYAGTENGKDKCIKVKNENAKICQCGSPMYENICMECGYMQEGGDVFGQPSEDHEASMAKAELRDMINNAEEIYEMIEVGTELPGWISSYITLASDYMHSVKEYIAGKAAEKSLQAPEEPEEMDFNIKDQQ